MTPCADPPNAANARPRTAARQRQRGVRERHGPVRVRTRRRDHRVHNMAACPLSCGLDRGSAWLVKAFALSSRGCPAKLPAHRLLAAMTSGACARMCPIPRACLRGSSLRDVDYLRVVQGGPEVPSSRFGPKNGAQGSDVDDVMFFRL